MINGYMYFSGKGYYGSVWPVRGGQWGDSIISGSVHDTGTAAPLATAAVTIGAQTVQTDAAGTYSATVPPGSYAVTASKTGYVSLTESVTVAAGSTTIRDFSLTPLATSGGIQIVDISSKYGGFLYYLTGTNFTVDYIATVDWGGHQPGKVRFITSKNSYEVATNGSSAKQSLNMGLEFSPCSTLKVVATSADGATSPEKSADFTTMSPVLGALAFDALDVGNGFYYKSKLGLDLTLLDEAMDAKVIPENIPLFGKKGFNLRFVPSVTTSIDSSGAVDIGLEFGNKPYLAASIAGVDFSLKQTLNITGQYLHPGCRYQWGGSVGLAGSMKAEKSWPFIFLAGPVPVPMFAKASVALDAGLNLAVENIDPRKLNGNFDINPKVRGSLEAGADHFLSVGGWLGGGTVYQFQYPQTPNLKNVLVDLNGGVTLTALLWSWEDDLFHWGWSMNGKTAVKALSSISSPAGATPISRDYLNAPNAGAFIRAPKYALKSFALGSQPYSVAVTPIVTSIFPQANSFLSSAGSNVNLIWVTDSPARSANNRTMLVHSTFDGTSWSAPQPVSDDGTADFHPVSLTFSDGTIIAAWEDEKGALPDTAGFDTAVAALEISAASYDPTTKSWGTATRQSSDPYLHRTPKLAGKAKNNVLLTWLSNEANDLSGSSVKPNKLWYSIYNGATWSAPAVAAIIPNGVKRYTVAYDGTTAHVVLALHSSDDLTILDNLELYRLTYTTGIWGPLTRLTTDTVIDDNPQLALDVAGNFILNWVRGAELSSAINFDFTNRSVVRADTEYSSNLADFKQATATDGRVALIYAQPSATSSSDLYGVFYDPTFGSWGQPKQLTSDPETESHPSIAFLGAETIIATYNRKLMLNADGTVPTTATYTDLYMLKHTLGVDLALESGTLIASPLNPAPGDAVTFTVTAHNVGDKPVSDAMVAFYNGDPASGGVKIGSTTISGTFNAGGSRDATVSWTVPVTTTPLTIHAVIDPESLLDPLSRSDNSVSTVTVMPDLAVGPLSWEKLSDTLISIIARISNSGGLATTPTTVTFRKDGPAGAILSTQNVPALVKGGSGEFAITYDISALSDPYYTVYVAVDEANSVVEFDESNNSGSVTFPGKQQDLMKKLTVQFTGTGGGTVSDASAGLSCGSNCQRDIVWNSPLNLTAVASQYSLFTGWSGGGCSGTANCVFTVTTPVTVTANFTQDSAHSVRGDGPPQVNYSSLQDAFTLAPTCLLRAWGVTFIENLTLNRSVAFKLLGGQNADYSASVGMTTIQGKLTIGKGSLVAERITIR